MIRYFIIFVSTLFFFSSCEKEVTIDVAPISSKLVVISNFSGSNEGHVLNGDFFLRDSVMRVTVSRTEPALSISGDTLIHVPDAVVELYSGSQFLERLSYHPLTAEEKALGFEPYYEAENFRLSAGETYNLEVWAPQFAIVRAEGSIPPIVSETESSISISESTTSNGFKDVDFTFNLDIVDLPLVNNYYHLNLYQVVNLLRINGITGDTSRTPVLMGPLAFDLQNNDQEVLPYIENRGVLIRDDSFDGDTGSFTFEGNFLYNPQSEELGDFIVELRNTSKDYYLYHSSLARQVRVQSGFDAISGPVVLHNNIDNGFGIFAGYTPSYTTLDLSD